jgi:hypothetical protein
MSYAFCQSKTIIPKQLSLFREVLSIRRACSFGRHSLKLATVLRQPCRDAAAAAAMEGDRGARPLTAGEMRNGARKKADEMATREKTIE